MTQGSIGSDHEIRLQTDKEISWGPLYGMSRDKSLVLKKTLTDLLDKNYIRAVLSVKKPGGGLRFCVDYRALNLTSEADRFPLSLTREPFVKMSKAKYFTEFDVRVALDKFRIKKRDEWKIVFHIRFGLF